MLEATGYETSENWWQDLPEARQGGTSSQSDQVPDQVVRLRKRNETLERHYREERRRDTAAGGHIQSLQRELGRKYAGTESGKETDGIGAIAASGATSDKDRIIRDQATVPHELKHQTDLERDMVSQLSGELDNSQRFATPQLEAKEAVIQRQASGILRIRSVARTILGVGLYRALCRHFAKVITPRLGTLTHYPPREMRRLPAPRISSGASPVPSISIVTPLTISMNISIAQSEASSTRSIPIWSIAYKMAALTTAPSNSSSAGKMSFRAGVQNGTVAQRMPSTGVSLRQAAT